MFGPGFEREVPGLILQAQTEAIILRYGIQPGITGYGLLFKNREIRTAVHSIWEAWYDEAQREVIPNFGLQYHPGRKYNFPPTRRVKLPNIGLMRSRKRQWSNGSGGECRKQKQ